MIACDATDSADVVNVALPATKDALPRVVTPSLNVTVPVAVEGDTEALNVTPAPNEAGFADDVRAVADAA